MERELPLSELAGALNDASAGRGCVVLVTGEAGVGKTALVRQFLSEAAARSKTVWGMCDELVTPRPLGPFRDVGAQLGLPAAGEHELLESVVAALGAPSPYPTVAVIEDAHWADAATGDAIRFVGRRVRNTNAMLIVTLRDEDTASDHLIRRALAAVPPDDVRRVRLAPLSLDAVRRLAGYDDVADLYELTGGNPFFVTEILAASDAAVPATVQDAVMARVGQLSDIGRECAETASVVPGRIERWLLEACAVADGVEEAERRGLIQSQDDVVVFNHEIARRAVERSVRPSRRRELNRRVLDALVERQADLARLVHHAAEAHDGDAVAQFAPAAARHAAALDSHREAADHFQRALRYSESYPAPELASLHYEYARECWLTERHGEAERALGHAAALHSELGDDVALGADLSLLSNVRWLLGRGREAEETSARAITVLERQPPSAALGRAYEQRARLALVDWRLDQAIEWGDQATRLAREHDDVVTAVDAMISAGWSRWMVHARDNTALERALELAVSNGMAIQAARAYGNLASGYLERMEAQAAGRCLNEGLAFCDEHDLLTAVNWFLVNRSSWHIDQGRWDDAEADARQVIKASGTSVLAAKTCLALLYVRQGREGAEGLLSETREMASQSGDAQDRVPVLQVALEFAWARGELAAHTHLAAEMDEMARRSHSPRMIGAATLWRHRSGLPDESPQEVIQPIALQIAGRWRESADAWQALGRPYDQADALADADEPEALLEALAILDRLGARPRAAMVRRRLAEMGVTSIPRGPRESTRSNVAGLTARQLDVLTLMAEDLTYQEIAERLYVSAKTVDHHASAIRAKLGVTTGAAAVARAQELGILGAGRSDRA